MLVGYALCAFVAILVLCCYCWLLVATFLTFFFGVIVDVHIVF
jgi:hypothetical protein